jgi:citrate synthase
MFDVIKRKVQNVNNDGEVRDVLASILRGELGDGSGKIYGMGHAIYTKSDPRAVMLKKYAEDLAHRKGFGDDFVLLEAIERLTPEVFAEHKGNNKAMCANVDLYSGLVYRMLDIPVEMYTPLFAVARVAGWCAHRIEEFETAKRIIRPAYKCISKQKNYVPLSER